MPNPTPDPQSEAPRLVLVTAPNAETAERLAEGLLERELCACCNLVPGVTSLYRWEGAVQRATEQLMLVKTTAEHLRAVQAFLKTEHPYDVPECIALEPAAVEGSYLAWWLAAVRGGR